MECYDKPVHHPDHEVAFQADAAAIGFNKCLANRKPRPRSFPNPIPDLSQTGADISAEAPRPVSAVSRGWLLTA